jgi:hypothetical protein
MGIIFITTKDAWHWQDAQTKIEGVLTWDLKGLTLTRERILCMDY